MNKKTREQLRACIAKDLIQGQGQHYPTKALLKHYVPLEGIITTPASDVSSVPGSVPVENTMAPHATVALHAHTMAQDATVAPGATVAGAATVARYAMVNGELRVPNTISCYRMVSGGTPVLWVFRSWQNRLSCRRESFRRQ
jgi:hypothetical protein